VSPSCYNRVSSGSHRQLTCDKNFYGNCIFFWANWAPTVAFFDHEKISSPFLWFLLKIVFPNITEFSSFIINKHTHTQHKQVKMPSLPNPETTMTIAGVGMVSDSFSSSSFLFLSFSFQNFDQSKKKKRSAMTHTIRFS